MHRHHADDVAARLALAFDLGRAGGDMSEESEQRRRLPPFEGERLPEQFVDRIARLAHQPAIELADRKSVVTGQSVSGRVDPGGRRIIQKKNKALHHEYIYCEL